VAWALAIASFDVRTARKRSMRRREHLSAESPAMGGEFAEEQISARDLEAAAIDVVGTLRPSDIETLRCIAGGKRPPIPGPLSASGRNAL
jgi:hypothetical protein